MTFIGFLAVQTISLAFSKGCHELEMYVLKMDSDVYCEQCLPWKKGCRRCVCSVRWKLSSV